MQQLQLDNKGYQLPTIEKNIELGIGLAATQAKLGASIKDTNGQK